MLFTEDELESTRAEKASRKIFALAEAEAGQDISARISQREYLGENISSIISQRGSPLREYLCKDISARIYLQGYLYKDISARIYLLGYLCKDISARMYLQGYLCRDIAARIYLLGYLYKDISAFCKQECIGRAFQPFPGRP